MQETISYNALAPAIKSGYASASTDTGHVASDTTWLSIEDREKDYGFRAIHGMTVAAKAILRQFYGRAAQRSYFNGCSTGGGQGFGEAQLYPQDFDGILAGAPRIFPPACEPPSSPIFKQPRTVRRAISPKNTLSLITTAVLSQCGGKDALADGFLSEDPRTCRFDPEGLLCKNGQDQATCLTAPQVTAVRKIYAGAIDPRTSELIWPGLMPGSEEPAGPGTVGWQLSGMNGPTPFAAAAQFYSFGVFQNPDFNFHAMDIGSAVQISREKIPLPQPHQHGHRCLLSAWWQTSHVSRLGRSSHLPAELHQLLRQPRRGHREQTPSGPDAARTETQKAALLFMVPGMGHCSGGPGPDNFDAIGALDQWVDTGVAPGKIIASHLSNGAPTFSRPLCPYPQEARYTGSGDRANANNWACTAQPFAFDSNFYKARPDR